MEKNSQPTNPAFFQVDQLSKSFGALTAVNQVSFVVNEFEILGIAGPNGSGKSTLFNILTNIPFRADSGEVLFRGKEIQHLASHVIGQQGVARTFQKESVFRSLSAIDNVLTAVEHNTEQCSHWEAEQRAQAALDLVEFPPNMHNALAGTLPVFYRKLVMIASAMALKPSLLLLDEPASGLTKSEIDRLEKLIIKLNDHGMTIILIEHVLSLLTKVSDRLIVLDQGTLICEGNAEFVINDPKVVEAYLGGAK